MDLKIYDFRERNYRIQINHLWSYIAPEKSKYKLKDNTITVVM